MTTSPSPYQTMVTPRSRRLRTTGLVLLATAVSMALYGFFVLMPTLKRSAVVESHRIQDIRGEPGGISRPVLTIDQAARIRRSHRVVAVQVLAAYGYWTICGLISVAMVFVAWLDLREVSRTYLQQRRAIWAETASRLDTHTKDQP